MKKKLNKEKDLFLTPEVWRRKQAAVPMMIGALMLLGIIACSPKVRTVTVPDDAPCWVKPGTMTNCQDKTPNSQYVYFRGTLTVAKQTMPTDPDIESIDFSAREQATKMIETTIAASSEKGLIQAGSSAQGSQAVNAFKNYSRSYSKQSIVGMMRVAYYPVFTDQNNSEGIPLWTTYVLYRIPQQNLGKAVENLVRKVTEDPVTQSISKVGHTAEGLANVSNTILMDTKTSLHAAPPTKLD